MCHWRQCQVLCYSLAQRLQQTFQARCVAAVLHCLWVHPLRLQFHSYMTFKCAGVALLVALLVQQLWHQCQRQTPCTLHCMIVYTKHTDQCILHANVRKFCKDQLIWLHCCL